MTRRIPTNETAVPLASYHHGPCTCTPTSLAAPYLRDPATALHQAAMTLTSATGRLTVLGRRLLPRDPLPDRLPLQAAEGQLHHPHLPP
jgi:hypothetical protein